MLNYILIVMFLTSSGYIQLEQIGPFKNLFACEQAALQVQLISPARAHTACLNDDARSPTWGGKPLKKPRQIPRKESK